MTRINTALYTSIVCALMAMAHAPAEAACLGKAGTNPDGSPAMMRILAPTEEVGAYEALGFKEETCAVSKARATKFVDFICSLAAKTPKGADASGQTRGLTPAQLCQSGQAALTEMKDK